MEAGNAAERSWITEREIDTICDKCLYSQQKLGKKT